MNRISQWWRNDPTGIRAIPSAAWFVIVSLARAAGDLIKR